MDIEISSESWLVLIAFGGYLLGVALLGVFSHRYLTRGSFVKEYFLGNRGLGPWVLALTVAATAISGGTFMGFPSLIYSKGWVLALWVASYMVVPLLSMALMGKRLNQIARLTGSVTVPDVFRDRFQSPALGIVSTLLILLFLIFNLVAQFKAGGLVMMEAMKLRPATAEYQRPEVQQQEESQSLVLHFLLADGRHETQKTPLPKEARFLRAEAEPDNRQVIVVYQLDAKEETRKVSYPAVKVGTTSIEMGYLLGLIVFALTVVAYTTYGGFWAVTWTDVLEGVVMLVGVIIMAILAMRAVPAIDVQRAAPNAMGQAEFVTEKVYGLAAATERLRQEDPRLVRGPGPEGFMPVGLALSFFLMWSLMGPGQPSGMVRLMSFKDTPSLRRAMVLIGGYMTLTYFSLVIIFICARAIFPTQYLHEYGSEGVPDSIMPAMARFLAPHPTVAGLLLAAPYAAIMSTVAAFLLMISSSLVRDLYQRTINPAVSDRGMKFASYLITGLVGLIVMIGALNPPDFLQYIIVFTGTGQGCAFLVPMLLALYWPRATRQGILASMLGGFAVVFLLYVLGWAQSAGWMGSEWSWIPGWDAPRPTAFSAIYLGHVDTLIWGLLASIILGIGVSLMTQPERDMVEKYFPAAPAKMP